MSDLMIEIDLSQKLENVDGSIDEKTLGKLLGELLLSETNGDPIKLYTWGRILRKGEDSLAIDGTDFKTLYEIVKATPRIVVSAKAQIMMAMDDAKDAAKKSKLKPE